MNHLKFNVKCVENSVNQDQLLFYEVVCDSNSWAPAGKTSGIILLSVQFCYPLKIQIQTEKE